MAPSISERGTLVPPSPIRKLVPLADEAKKRGTHVFHVNIGQPDIETPPEMLAALRNLKTRVIHYTHSQGEPSYIDALVRYYAGCGIELRPEQINVTTGGSEAIIFAFTIALSPGEEVIIPEPFYTNYIGFSVMAGVTIRPLTTSVEDGFRLPPRERIEALVGPRTRAILLCNPNNPTGTVYTAEEIEAVAAICRERDLWLLTDEVYREFTYDGCKHISALSLAGMEERTIMMDSVSKRYSLCGARVGCLVSRNPEVMSAALRLGQARLCSPLVDQLVARAALDLPENYFEVTVAEYRRRRDAVFDELSKIEGVVTNRPCGAFYNIARLPVDDADRFCRWLLTDFEHEGQTVMLAPGNGFYATEGLGASEVRVAYVLKVEEMRRSMELLRIALEKYGA